MKSEHPVLLLCELLGVSRSGYYRRKMAPVSLRHKRPRRRPRTTDSRHARAVPGNHLAARPTPAGANQT